MARKRTASATTLQPDPRYGSKLASKFMNCLMWQGKKSTAERCFYGALEQIKKRMGENAKVIEVFEQAVDRIVAACDSTRDHAGCSRNYVGARIGAGIRAGVNKCSVAINGLVRNILAPIGPRPRHQAAGRV